MLTARTVVALAAGFAVALLAGTALSVARSVAIVNTAGQPVANATVTIVFPDGSTQEEETDDDGILFFDFPSAGDYTIRYPGGQMTYTVPRALAAGGGRAGLKAGMGAVIAGALAAVANNNNNNNNNGGATAVHLRHSRRFDRLLNPQCEGAVVLLRGLRASAAAAVVAAAEFRGR
jgi:hypothetical protein